MSYFMAVVTSLILLLSRIHLVLLGLLVINLGVRLIGHDLLAFVSFPFTLVRLRFLLDPTLINCQHLRVRLLALLR